MENTMKLRNILTGHTWEFFTMSNDYRGGEFDTLVEVDMLIADIQYGHARLVEDDEKYTLKFAGRCRWVAMKGENR